MKYCEWPYCSKNAIASDIVEVARYCQRHSAAILVGRNVCYAPMCGNVGQPNYRGMCWKHYVRENRNGTPEMQALKLEIQHKEQELAALREQYQSLRKAMYGAAGERRVEAYRIYEAHKDIKEVMQEFGIMRGHAYQLVAAGRRLAKRIEEEAEKI